VASCFLKYEKVVRGNNYIAPFLIFYSTFLCGYLPPTKDSLPVRFASCTVYCTVLYFGNVLLISLGTTGYSGYAGNSGGLLKLVWRTS
jgi:hypothetical protein